MAAEGQAAVDERIKPEYTLLALAPVYLLLGWYVKGSCVFHRREVPEYQL